MHVTCDLSKLNAPNPYHGSNGITVGNGESLNISHTGTGTIKTPTAIFHLGNLTHVPSIKTNLLSVHQFTKDNNCSLLFTSNDFQILDNTTKRVIFQGPCEHGLYVLPGTSSSAHPVLESVPVAPVALSADGHSLLWHSRLGHPSTQIINSLMSQLGFSSIHVNNCDSCSIAKSHKLPFTLSEKHTTAPFQLIHSKLWGPTAVPSFAGFCYYICFVDDFTKYTWLYPLKHKSQAYTTFVTFEKMVKTQFNSHVKLFRSDNGKEYVNNIFGQFLQSLGIIHQTSCPYTPEQNGVAERKHRHLIETVVTLLHQSHLPVSFWVEALATANYLINRMPSHTLSNKSPYQLLYQELPNYTNLRVFGCLAYPWLRPHITHKLQPRSRPCIFLGYHPTSKGYRCLDPQTHKVYISRHVKFVENEFPYESISSSTNTSFIGVLPLFPTYSQGPSPPSPTPPPTIQPPFITPSTVTHNTPATTTHTHNQPEPPHTHNISSSIRFGSFPATLESPPPVPPPNTHPMLTCGKAGIFKPKNFQATILPNTPLPDSEPTTYSIASKNAYWRHAMDEEFKALTD